jgi:hypothetical protein
VVVEVVSHSLGIQRFEARIALSGLREEGPRLGSEVSQAVQHMLPDAAGRALEPLLGSRGGVLRIERLMLQLRLDSRAFSGARLAEALARQLAGAVMQRADGSDAMPRAGPGFIYWPDHVSYAASYIATRMGLSPAPPWAFPDLRALVHLTPPEVALELIAARPAILSALARQLGPGAASTVVARLSDAMASALVARLAADVPNALPDGVLEDIAALLADLRVASGGGYDAVAIAAAFVRLATQGTQDGDAVRRVVQLARIAAALVAIKAVALSVWGRPPRAADLMQQAFAHLPAPVRRLAQSVLTPLTDDAATRAALVQLLGTASLLPAADATSPDDDRAETAPERSIASMLAGIGLLMPAVLSYDLPGLLSPTALHRTLVAAAGPEAAPMARLDPLITALAPFDPRGPDAAFPPVPGRLRAVVPGALHDGEAETEGAVGWAACLIHAFASDLAGFEGSTITYLRRQFLLRPGTLHFTDDMMTLVLDPMPLGILLRLRGPHGWTARLPQAHGALLRISVTES